MQSRNILRAELVGQGDRRQAGAVQDLVRVGVADAAEQMRIGQRALERMVFALQALAERRQIGGGDLESAQVECGKRTFAVHDVQ